MDHIDYLYCVVAAAGAGERFSSDTPKQFLPIAGRPLLAHTLDRLHSAVADARLLDKFRFIIAAPDAGGLPAGCCADDWPVTTVAGGATRQQSVAKALDCIGGLGAPDAEGASGRRVWALIHDGDRPCVDPDDIHRLLMECADWDGGFLCYPLSDSLVEIGDGPGAGKAHQCAPRPRHRHRLVATPQLFTVEAISASHRRARDGGRESSDDASLAIEAGYRIGALDSSPRNIKLTYPHELAGVELALSQPASRS